METRDPQQPGDASCLATRWLQAEDAACAMEQLASRTDAATPARMQARAFLARQLRVTANLHLREQLETIRQLQRELPLI
jgi:hypothetical protein